MQHQGEEQTSLLEADDFNIENTSDGKIATDMANKEKGNSAVHCSIQHFEPETRGEQANDYTKEKESASEECSKSSSQAQMFVSASEDDTQSCCAALEKQVVENKHLDLKGNQETTDKPSMTDVIESALAFPPKKKRRMGMCGLKEKERSLFLQARRHDKTQSTAGKPLCDQTSEPEEVSSALFQPTPPLVLAEVVEQSKEEPKPQPPQSGDDQRAEGEVYSVVTGSNGIGTTSNPGCSEDRNSQADLELSSNTEPNQPAKEEDEDHQENLQPAEVKEPTAGNIPLMPEIQIKTRVDLQSKVQTNSLNTSKGKDHEESDDAEAASPPMHRVNKTTDESRLQMTNVMFGNGAEEGASSADTQAEELKCGSEKLGEASLKTTGQERNHSCEPNDDLAAGPSIVHTDCTRIRGPEDTLASGRLDYVSDSQLNTIVLMEEREDKPDPSGHLEDATELICGLIRELSCLNRKVMVTHRELENLRRKPSRSSIGEVVEHKGPGHSHFL